MEQIFTQFNDIAAIFTGFMQAQFLYSSIIFMIIFAVTRLTRRFAPAMNFALWTLIFVRLVLSPDFTAPTSAWQFLPKFPEINVAAVRHIPQPAQPAVQSKAATAITGTESVDKSILPAAPQESPAGDPALPPGSDGLLFLLWLAGFISLSGIYFYKRHVFRAQLRQANLVTSPAMQAFAERWRTHLGIRRRVQLRSSDAFLSPFTIGVLRPQIFIPQQLLEARNNTTLQTIIAHEMVHIKNCDDFWLRLQHAVQIFYFFNPLVWIAAGELNQERERLCDARVLAEGSISRQNYGQSMLQVLKLNLFGFDGMALLPGFGSEKKRFKNRLQSIIKNQKEVRISMVSIALIFLSSIAFLLPAAPHTLVEPTPPASMLHSKIPVAENLSTTLNFRDPLRGKGYITARFGKMNKSTAKMAARFHGGIDIKARIHTPVTASESGTVRVAKIDYERNKGYGRYVEIVHANGFVTRYAHLKKVMVKTGQRVQAGDKIGTVGSTGKSSGPHLHFEILQNQKNLNPEIYVGFQQQFGDKAKTQASPTVIKALNFRQPVDGTFTAKFGPFKYPFLQEVRKHRGLDIAQKSGTAILAAAGGRVSAITKNFTENEGPGKVVEITHKDGFISRYTHMNSIDVEVNQAVRSGDQIGMVGSTGRSTGPHVHLEIEHAGAFVNPMIFIAGK